MFENVTMTEETKLTETNTFDIEIVLFGYKMHEMPVTSLYSTNTLTQANPARSESLYSTGKVMVTVSVTVKG